MTTAIIGSADRGQMGIHRRVLCERPCGDGVFQGYRCNPAMRKMMYAGYNIASRYLTSTQAANSVAFASRSRLPGSYGVPLKSAMPLPMPSGGRWFTSIDVRQ